MPDLELTAMLDEVAETLKQCGYQIVVVWPADDIAVALRKAQKLSELSPCCNASVLLN